MDLNLEGTATGDKLTLHRSQWGTVSFVDWRGMERTIDDPMLGEAIFETAVRGPGEKPENTPGHYPEPASNVHTRFFGPATRMPWVRGG